MENKNIDMIKKIMFARSKSKTCICYNGIYYGKNGIVNDISNYYVVEYEKQKEKEEKIEDLWNNHSNKLRILFEANIPDVQIRKLHGCDKLITRKILYEISEKIRNSTHMNDKTEIYFHMRASHGAFINCKIGIYNSSYYSYDINSCYSFILKSKNFKIPIKGGKVYKIKEIDINKTGIYKIKILSKIDPMLFNQVIDKKSEYSYYTDWDISRLNELEYEYELDNSDNNAYIYEDDDCVSGNFLFGDYINKLYDIKINTYSDIKKVLSKLWGEACSIKRTKIKFEEMYKYNPKNIISFDERKNIVYINTEEQPYNWTFIRMKPFMLSYARYIIGKLSSKIKKQNYDVIRIHTDSITTNCPPEKMNEIKKIDKQIGNLKIEKEFNKGLEIKNNNSIIKL